MHLEDIHTLQGPGAAVIPRDSALVDRALLCGRWEHHISQHEGLSRGRDGSAEHILNPPLERKERSYFDILSVLRGSTGEVLSTLLGSVALQGVWSCCPLPELGPKS